MLYQLRVGSYCSIRLQYSTRVLASSYSSINLVILKAVRLVAGRVPKMPFRLKTYDRVIAARVIEYSTLYSLMDIHIMSQGIVLPTVTHITVKRTVGTECTNATFKAIV